MKLKKDLKNGGTDSYCLRLFSQIIVYIRVLSASVLILVYQIQFTG